MDNQQEKPRKLTPRELLDRYRYEGKLTPRLRDSILSAVRNGTPPRVALRKHGLTPQTIANWQKWGETGEKGQKYVELSSGLESAWAQWQSFVAGTLPTHVERDARVAADIASKIMPEYQKRDEVAVTYDMGPMLADLARQLAATPIPWIEEGNEHEQRESEGETT